MSNIVKKSEVTEYMMNKRPIRVRDIGAGAKILVLEPVVNINNMDEIEVEE